MMPPRTRIGTRISDSMNMAYSVIRGKETGDRDRPMNSGRMVDEPGNATYMYTEATEGRIIYYDTNDGRLNTSTGMNKYIWQTLIKEGKISGYLKSEIQLLLRVKHNLIGNSQVTIKRLQSAPLWVTHKELKEEHYNNWSTSYQEVNEIDVHTNANLISSHVV